VRKKKQTSTPPVQEGTWNESVGLPTKRDNFGLGSYPKRGKEKESLIHAFCLGIWKARGGNKRKEHFMVKRFEQRSHFTLLNALVGEKARNEGASLNSDRYNWLLSGNGF